MLLVIPKILFKTKKSQSAVLKEKSYSFLFPLQAKVAGELGEVISGKLSVPKGQTVVFKSLGECTVQPH